MYGRELSPIQFQNLLTFVLHSRTPLLLKTQKNDTQTRTQNKNQFGFGL